jgi:molecular chaperone GrpE
MGEPTFDPEGSGHSGPVIRDRRRLDPETGKVREAYDGGAGSPASSPASSPDRPGDGSGEPSSDPAAPAAPSATAEPEAAPTTGDQITLDGILADLDAAQASAAERLSDLQRLQAEFVNYRRRVDRDRDVAREQAVASFLEALLPVLDDVHLARQHGDLESGPFAAIAEKLEAVLQRFGLARYGEAGEAFDPAVHEALMHTEADLAEGTTTTTVVQVLQPGYRTGDRVLRAARVAVADPQ